MAAGVVSCFGPPDLAQLSALARCRTCCGDAREIGGGGALTSSIGSAVVGKRAVAPLCPKWLGVESARLPTLSVADRERKGKGNKSPNIVVQCSYRAMQWLGVWCRACRCSMFWRPPRRCSQVPCGRPSVHASSASPQWVAADTGHMMPSQLARVDSIHKSCWGE